MVGDTIMTSLFGLLGHGMMLMALLLLILQVKRWKQYWPVAYLISAIIIILPIQNWLLIEFSRGYFSDLSMATIMVCLIFIVSGMRPQAITIDHSFKLFILVIAAILFPSSLGLGQYDLFSLGFPSEAGFDFLIAFVAAIGLFAWYKQATQLAWYIAAVLIAYCFGLYESQNIWVYLIDPIVMLVVILGYLIMTIKFMFQYIKSRLVKNV